MAHLFAIAAVLLGVISAMAASADKADAVLFLQGALVSAVLSLAGAVLQIAYAMRERLSYDLAERYADDTSSAGTA